MQRERKGYGPNYSCRASNTCSRQADLRNAECKKSITLQRETLEVLVVIKN